MLAHRTTFFGCQRLKKRLFCHLQRQAHVRMHRASAAGSPGYYVVPDAEQTDPVEQISGHNHHTDSDRLPLVYLNRDLVIGNVRQSSLSLKTYGSTDDEINALLSNMSFHTHRVCTQTFSLRPHSLSSDALMVQAAVPAAHPSASAFIILSPRQPRSLCHCVVSLYYVPQYVPRVAQPTIKTEHKLAQLTV